MPRCLSLASQLHFGKGRRYACLDTLAFRCHCRSMQVFQRPNASFAPGRNHCFAGACMPMPARWNCAEWVMRRKMYSTKITSCCRIKAAAGVFVMSAKNLFARAEGKEPKRGNSMKRGPAFHTSASPLVSILRLCLRPFWATVYRYFSSCLCREQPFLPLSFTPTYK